MTLRATQQLYREVDGEVLVPDSILEAEYDTAWEVDEGSFWQEHEAMATVEYTYVDGSVLIDGEKLTSLDRQRDMYVSLDLAYEAIKRAAQVYGQRARARGLSVGVQDTRVRDKIDRRMHKAIDTVVATVLDKTSYTLEEEMTLLEPAIGANKLRDEDGVFGADEEQLALSSLIYIRSKIGVTVGHAAREAYLKQLSKRNE